MNFSNKAPRVESQNWKRVVGRSAPHSAHRCPERRAPSAAPYLALHAEGRAEGKRTSPTFL